MSNDVLCDGNAEATHDDKAAHNLTFHAKTFQDCLFFGGKSVSHHYDEVISQTSRPENVKALPETVAA